MHPNAASDAEPSRISRKRRHGRKEGRKRRRSTRNLLFETLEVRHLLAAWVDGLQLLNDTGSSPTDLVTSDPQVTGTVQGDFTDGYVEVQFDHFANGYVDGYVYAYGPGEQFTYDPRWYDYSLEDYAGSFTLNYRTVEYDSSYNAVTGPWQSFTFTLEVPAAPEISVSYWDIYYGYQQDVYSGYSSVPFPATTVGTPVATTLAIHNYGTADLVLDTASLTLPSGFSLMSPFATSVAPGGSTSFTVQLDAAGSGYFHGTVAFTSNDSDRNPFEFFVYGDVGMPQPEISVRYTDQYGYEQELYAGYSSVYFDATSVGLPVEQTFAVYNTGDGALALDVSSFALPSGFTLLTPPAAQVAAGASTAFTVRVDAIGGGDFQGPVSFETNDEDENPFQFWVYAQVVAPQPEIAVRYTDEYGYEEQLYHGYSSVYFDATSVGAPVDKTFTVYNQGDGELALDPASFSLPAGFALLTAPATPVVPGGSTSFTVRLDAADAGQFQGQMSFATNVPYENPFQFWVYGQVAAPQPEVVVRYTDAYGYEEELYSGYSGVYFGSTVVNSPVSQAFSISNPGSAALELNPASLVVPSGFSIVTPFAPTVPPGGSTVLVLQLDATASGTFSGTASFGTNDVARNPFSFNVYGEVSSDVGVPSVTVLGPSGTVLSDGSGVFSFGHTADGSPTSRTFTVRNDGTGPLTLDAASLQLPAGFSLVTSFASELAAGAASSFTIRLDAGSTGYYQGPVSFANSDPYRNPYSFHVEGTVIEPAPEISVRYQSSGGYVQEIYDGNSTVYFPSTSVGQAVSRTFTVHNVGAAPLILDLASLSLPAGYSLLSAFATEVAPGTSTAFVVQLDSQSPGHFSGTLSFANNDADENPFDFFLYGHVTASQPAVCSMRLPRRCRPAVRRPLRSNWMRRRLASSRALCRSAVTRPPGIRSLGRSVGRWARRPAWCPWPKRATPSKGARQATCVCSAPGIPRRSRPSTTPSTPWRRKPRRAWISPT